MTVHADGTVILDHDGQTRTATVDAAAIRALEQTFAGQAWQELEPIYGQQFPDTFAYTVKGGGKEVTTYDGVDRPEVLETVLQRLGQLYQSVDN